jgi:hypothetical protein
MTTALLVIGGIWLLLGSVFCLALCAAAGRPLPKFEVEPAYRPSQERAEERQEGCAVNPGLAEAESPLSFSE